MTARTLPQVVFIDGVRIPFQRSNTGYRELTSFDLARLAMRALLEKTDFPPQQIDWVLMGTVIQNVRTPNVARDAALAAGIPRRVPAATLTLACISANKAVTVGMDLIRTGQARVVLAGGTESLTDVPIRFRKRFRQKLVEAQKYRGVADYLTFFKGLRPSDLLPEIPQVAEFTTGRTMGEDCEMLASRIGVSRREQDEYALRSHRNAARAVQEGLLKEEVIPVQVPPDYRRIEFDNGPRADTTLEKLARLKPAFVKPHGTLTAGNSSFLTDGAAVTLIMAEDTARRMGLQPKAYLRDYVYTAQDPDDELLLGPAYATPELLDKTGLALSDIDVFEFHEAFAAQILANLKLLASDTFAREKLGRDKAVGEIPMEKFNTLGGSLSLGHPFGATGARLVTTAVNRLIREDGQWALVAACAAGAMGNAILIERYG